MTTTAAHHLTLSFGPRAIGLYQSNAARAHTNAAWTVDHAATLDRMATSETNPSIKAWRLERAAEWRANAAGWQLTGAEDARIARDCLIALIND